MYIRIAPERQGRSLPLRTTTNSHSPAGGRARSFRFSRRSGSRPGARDRDRARRADPRPRYRSVTKQATKRMLWLRLNATPIGQTQSPGRRQHEYPRDHERRCRRAFHERRGSRHERGAGVESNPVVRGVGRRPTRGWGTSPKEWPAGSPAHNRSIVSAGSTNTLLGSCPRPTLARRSPPTLSDDRPAEAALVPEVAARRRRADEQARRPAHRSTHTSLW